MNKGKEFQLTDLADIVSQTEKLVGTITEPELRRIAFDRILEHLLKTGMATVDAKPKIGRTKAPKDRIAKTKGSTKPGPKIWIQELVDEGFFENHQSSAAIREALDERGHILQATDLTYPLASLVEEKVLRRKKITSEDRGKSQVHWYNW